MNIFQAAGFFFTNNWLQILVSTLAGLVIGGVWYGPIFGKTWKKLVGIEKLSKDKQEQMMKYGMASNIIGTVLQVLILGTVLSQMQILNFVNMVMAIFLLWLGFTFITLNSINIYSARPLKATLINSGYALLVWVVTGAIFYFWY